MIYSISLFEIINAVVPKPRIVLWITAAAVDTAVVYQEIYVWLYVIIRKSLTNTWNVSIVSNKLCEILVLSVVLPIIFDDVL